MSTDYSDEQLETQYNNQRRVPQFSELVAQWRRRSSDTKKFCDCRLDLRYGNGPRDHYDYYGCGNSKAPLLVYLHGGYWQGGDKSLYAFLTPGPVNAGFNVAIPNYNLCPQVALETIAPQLARAMIHLHRQASDLGFDPQQIYLSGHSAGGHLGAVLLATHFSRLDAQLPASIFAAGILISGLFELPPLIPTSINAALGLTRERALRLSPVHMRPVRDTPVLACVGAEESEEFLRQSVEFSHAWQPGGRYLEIPGANHFTILESLGNQDGLLCAGLHELRVSIV